MSGKPADLAGCAQEIEGSFLFFDVSGFTSLSESFGRHGRDGTEELSRILNEFFDPLIELISDAGGDILKFGGDALTAFLIREEGELAEGNLRRAASLGLSAVESMRRFARAETRFGRIQLSVKAGISNGRCLVGVIGDPEERLELVVAGRPLDRMAEAEHCAANGQVVVDTEAVSLVEPGLEVEEAGQGFSRLRKAPKATTRGEARMALPPDLRLDPFFIPTIRRQAEAGHEGLLSEHRKVVSLFCGFSGLDYSDPSSINKLDSYFRRVRILLRDHGGTFNLMDMGDKGSKMLCFFGAPESRRDDEQRALSFALALRDLEREVSWLGRQAIGLYSGFVYCGIVGSSRRKSYTVIGDAVNTAARLMGAAVRDGGGVLVGAELRKSQGGRFRFGAYRSLQLKGKRTSVKVTQLIGSKRRKRRRPLERTSQFVGRRNVLARFDRALKRAIGGAAPPPQIVTGPAGQGKSAFLQAFLGRAARKGCRTVLGETPYLRFADSGPFVEIFEALLERKERAETTWPRLLPTEGPYLCLGLRFLGRKVPLTREAEALDEESRWKKTLALLARTLEKLAIEAPLVIAVDDLHQAGPETTELFRELHIRTALQPILFLGATRGNVQKPGREVALPALSEDEILRLACSVAGARRIDVETLQWLAGRSEANPFFLEEILRSLRERDAIQVDREGWLRISKDDAGEVPERVEGILLSRIDRAPLACRNLLKVASCLGSSFPLHLLRAIVHGRLPGLDVERHLPALEAFGLAPGEGPAGAALGFRHAILRETVYHSLLGSFRREVHMEAARYLDAASESDPWLVAYHFAEGECLGEAIDRGIAAVKHRRARFSLSEAAEIGTKLLCWYRESGRRPALAVQLLVADTFLQAGEVENTGDLISAMPRKSDMPEWVRVQYLFRLKTGRYREAASLIEDWLSGRGEEAGEERLRFLMALGALRIRLGEIEQAEAALSAIVGTTGDPATRAEALCYLGTVALQQGRLAEGGGSYEKALGLSEESGALMTQIISHQGLSSLAQMEGRNDDMRFHVEAALAVAKGLGDRNKVLECTLQLAQFASVMDRAGSALDLLSEIRPLIQTSAPTYATAFFWLQVGVAQYQSSVLPKALSAFRKAARLARVAGVPQMTAQGEFNVADTLESLGRSREAVRHYRRALRLFFKLGDRPNLEQAAAALDRLHDGKDPVAERLRKKLSCR